MMIKKEESQQDDGDGRGWDREWCDDNVDQENRESPKAFAIIPMEEDGNDESGELMIITMIKRMSKITSAHDDDDREYNNVKER